jgi:alkylhydroperoxidase family enzyme
MKYAAITGLPIISEAEATGELETLYTEVKRIGQFPVVPNIVTAVGASVPALRMYWALWRAMIEHSTLPESLRAMIFYTIAEKSHCEYCSASFELSCRSLGVDEETLAKLTSDLPSVSPLRIKAIIEFALKAAKDPLNLVAEDYEAMREQGVADEEIIEIAILAAISVASDVISDSPKVQVDDIIAEALGR